MEQATSRRQQSKKRRWNAFRKALFEECGGNCIYCGNKMFLPVVDKFGYTDVSENTATIDHIIPLNKGGTSAQINLIVCCRRCNGKKSNKSLIVWLKSLASPEPKKKRRRGRRGGRRHKRKAKGNQYLLVM